MDSHGVACVFRAFEDVEETDVVGREACDERAAYAAFFRAQVDLDEFFGLYVGYDCGVICTLRDRWLGMGRIVRCERSSAHSYMVASVV